MNYEPKISKKSLKDSTTILENSHNWLLLLSKIPMVSPAYILQDIIEKIQAKHTEWKHSLKEHKQEEERINHKRKVISYRG